MNIEAIRNPGLRALVRQMKDDGASDEAVIAWLTEAATELRRLLRDDVLAIPDHGWPKGTPVWVKWGSLGKRAGIVVGHSPKRVRVRMTDGLSGSQFSSPGPGSLTLRETKITSTQD